MLDAIPGTAWLNAGSQVISAAMQRPPQTSISGVTSTPVINSWFDGAGWTVATGGSKATGGTVGEKSSGGAPIAASSFPGGMSALIIGGATLLGLLLWKS